MDEWQLARKEFLAREAEFANARAALRRPVPMAEVDYAVEGPHGRVRLADLFCGHRQLVIYHFVFDAGCLACSFLVDNIGHPAHLNAADTPLVVVSPAPLATLQSYRATMGWKVPWYSSYGTDFAGPIDGSHHSLSVFVRENGKTYAAADHRELLLNAS